MAAASVNNRAERPKKRGEVGHALRGHTGRDRVTDCISMSRMAGPKGQALVFVAQRFALTPDLSHSASLFRRGHRLTRLRRMPFRSHMCATLLRPASASLIWPSKALLGIGLARNLQVGL